MNFVRLATKEKNSCFRKDVVNGDKGRKVNCHLEYEDVFKKSNRFCHQRIGVSQSTYDSNFDPIDEEKFTSCGYRLRSSRGKDLLTVDIESTYNGSKAERMIDNSSDCNSYSSSPDHSNSVITRVGSQLQLPRGVLYLKVNIDGTLNFNYSILTCTLNKFLLRTGYKSYPPLYVNVQLFSNVHFRFL